MPSKKTYLEFRAAGQSKTKKGYSAPSKASEKAPTKLTGMAGLVEELIAVTLPTVDPEMREVNRRPPATPAQLAALEKIWGRPLPPSYRAFLEVTNGLDGDAFTHRLLGTEDQKWASKQIDEMSEFWDDFDRSNIFPVAVPEAGMGIRNLAAFAKGKGEELPVVDWDNGEELERSKSFEAYVRDQIKLQHQVAKSQVKEAKKEKAQAKKIDAGLEKLAAGTSVPKSGKEREAAFEAIFELEDASEAASAVERLVAAKPSASELESYLNTLAHEMVDEEVACARAELIFHPKLDVPKASRSTWMRVANNVISIAFPMKNAKRSERWADVARPFVRENAYLGHNLACAYVLVGRIDDAFEMCKAAIEVGYAQATSMRTDADLGPLLKDSKFQELFGPPDEIDTNARTSFPRNAKLEADLIAGKAPVKLGAWLKEREAPLGLVIAADVAADETPQAKKGARARFASYKKEVLDKAFPLLAKHFTHFADREYYFSFHYGLLEKLDSFRLNTAKERAEVMALLADPHATFVKHLTLRGAKLGDLSLYARHPALRRIDHGWTDISQVTSLAPLAKLTQLRALDLKKSKVSDLRPLAKLPLVQLYLDKTSVTDLSPLAKHPTLSHLTLDGTKVKDLTPLFSCPKLSAVSLYGVKIEKAQIDKLEALVKKRRPNRDEACIDGYAAGVIH